MLKDKTIKICNLIIEYGFLAIVFFVPLIFDFSTSSYNRIDLYRIVFFRVILGLILLGYITKIFIESKLSLRGGNKIFLLVFFLLTSYFISSFFSLDPGQSFLGNFFRQQGFYNFGHYLLFFLLLILNIQGFKQIKRIIGAVILAGFLVSCGGLIQIFNFDFLSRIGGTSSYGRIFSTLGQPNFFGHWLILVLPLSIYAWIFLAKRFLTRFFLGLAIAAQLVCLLFTYSRAAWLGFLGSMIFLLLAWLVYRRRKKTALGLLALLLIGLATVISLNLTGPASSNYSAKLNFSSRLKSAVDFNGGSGKMRLYYLETGVKIIKQGGLSRLFVGYGPETLANVFIKYYQPDWGVYETINSLPDRAHNWLFDQLLALGLLGLMANLIFYIYLIYLALKYLLAQQKFTPESWLVIFLFSSLAAYCVNNLFSFSLFAVLVYLYLILALNWCLINFSAPLRSVDLRLTVVSKVLIWLSLSALLAVLSYTNNLNQVRAEIHYMKALKFKQAADRRGVIKQMEKVMSLSPSTDYYRSCYVYLTLDCFSLINDRAAREQLREIMLEQAGAIKNKTSYEYLNNLARAHTLFGYYLDKNYYEAAEKILNGLIADFPYLIAAYEDLGKQKMAQENYYEAVAVFKRAVEVLPPVNHPYLDEVHRSQISSIAVRLNESIGQAYFKLKNYDLALGYYKKGLALDPYRATLYKNIADIYYTQGRLDQTVAWNERGLTLNPSDYNWPLALSLLYRDQKDLARARDYLSQALKLAPENNELKKYYQELNK